MQVDYTQDTWRTYHFSHMDIVAAPGLTDVYEFGVFTGKSLAEMDRILRRKGVKYERLLGFDSFEGIPKETAEPCAQDVWDPDKSTFFKAFNASLALESTPEEAVELIARSVRPLIDPDVKLHLVRGFYSDSLTDTLPREMGLGKALWVDIDVDIYSSAITVLDWLFKHELVAKGTYVSYDDWGGTPGYLTMADGESRAHREVSEKYGVEWEVVAGNLSSGQVVFRIK